MIFFLLINVMGESKICPMYLLIGTISQLRDSVHGPLYMLTLQSWCIILQLQCAEDLNKPMKDFIPIFVSLAQTYTDDKQYKNAIMYYKREISARENDEVQVCTRTVYRENTENQLKQKGLNFFSDFTFI